MNGTGWQNAPTWLIGDNCMIWAGIAALVLGAFMMAWRTPYGPHVVTCGAVLIAVKSLM